MFVNIMRVQYTLFYYCLMPLNIVDAYLLLLTIIQILLLIFHWHCSYSLDIDL